jgi:hypothetical protein
MESTPLDSRFRVLTLTYRDSELTPTNYIDSHRANSHKLY